MRLALIVEYEGTRYSGFQYQANAPTIQRELELALGRLTGDSPRVTAAGRTDAGVHATGQVVALDTRSSLPPQTFVHGMNFHLPDDIAVKSAYYVDAAFDPRLMAISRRYRYTIRCSPTRSPLARRTAFRFSGALDVPRMRDAALLFVGRHDFARFAGPLSRPEAGSVRDVLDAQVRQSCQRIEFEVEANAFLPHQVRRMAGALVDVGAGRLAVSDIDSLINGEAPVPWRARCRPRACAC